MSDDHYLTLGIGRLASEREIARAYRRLARRYHPDVSAAPADTLQLFLAVQRAYETLSNTRRRVEYDAQLARYEQQGDPPVTTATVVVAAPVSEVGDLDTTADQRPPPSAQSSTAAVSLTFGSALLLPVSLLVENTVGGRARFLWAALVLLLSLIASFTARSLAARQLVQLWRWTASGGGGALRRTEAGRAVARRIRIADDIARVGQRLILCGMPIVLLLGPR